MLRNARHFSQTVNAGRRRMHSLRKFGLLAGMMVLALSTVNCSKVAFAPKAGSSTDNGKASAGADNPLVFPVPQNGGIPDLLENESQDATPLPTPTPAPDLDPGEGDTSPATPPPAPSPTPAPMDDSPTPPVVIDGKNCFGGQIPAIAFDAIPVSSAAAPRTIVNYRAPILEVESAGDLMLTNIHASVTVKKAEHLITASNLHAAHDGGVAITARAIGSLANVHAPMTVANAVSISHVANIHSTLLRLTTRELDGLANMHGTSLCVSAQTIGHLTNLHAPVIAVQGRMEGGVRASLPTATNLHAGYLAFSGLEMDSLSNAHSAEIVIHNAKIEHLSNIHGTIVLENSEIGSITNHHGKLYRKNSSVGAISNGSELQPDGALP